MCAVNVRRTYPPHLASAGRARAFVAQLLGDNALDTFGAQLVTSELVTNAIIHGGTDVEVSVWVTESRAVRIEVADGSSCCDLPVRSPPRHAVSGRGLSIVEQLADEWGVEPNEGGKMVWATLAGAAKPHLP
jgi:anti-sigma regulatory factor (Ser/Thr protein kinase)